MVRSIARRTHGSQSLASSALPASLPRVQENLRIRQRRKEARPVLNKVIYDDAALTCLFSFFQTIDDHVHLGFELDPVLAVFR